MEILCFYAGIAFFYTHSPYAVLFMLIGLLFKASRWVLLWFIVAILWSLIHQWWVAEQGIPNTDLIAKATVRGKVVSIPSVSEEKAQFQFLISELNGKKASAYAMLSCYQHCPEITTGQYWQFDVKLKKPQPPGNPGAINYRQTLQARHIHWTGYLKNKNHKLLRDESKSSSVLNLRFYLSALIQKYLNDPVSAGIVQALTLGVTNHIDKAEWELFRRTGTTHLMVISGAHIGLVAGLIYSLCRWIWTRFPGLCLYRPAQQAGSIGGILAALVYSLLAGFAVPAQRSLIACTLMLSKNFGRQRFTGWQTWRYALLIVLLIEPHAVLLPGFYLSFIAVATLISTSQRISHLRGLKKIMALQIACLLGLMPLTLFWFSYGAINGLLANLIAIPLVGYAIVPLGLLGVLLLLCFKTAVVLWPVISVIHLLMWYLHTINSLAWMNFEFGLNNILQLFALSLAVSLAVFLPDKKLILALSLFVVCTIFPYYPKVKEGDFILDVLDVGQGLSVVLRTANHILVYDTGMKFYHGSDMAELAINPYLRTIGIKKIDKVVISHPDLDHRGGLPSLEKRFPVGELIVDNVKFYKRGKNCHLYPDWEWDGIHFHFFPIQQTFRDKNNSSCVLQISNRNRTMLLTGDIEKRAENYLTGTYGKQLAADLLVVAHHGSKTSSTEEFIEQVQPRFAVISAGFDNRYHFPHPQTLLTLKKAGAIIYNTINCGMLEWNDAEMPVCYRKEELLFSKNSSS
ncbi:DNA internalization-related competence protein ComEC/Rec2 [Legionella quinlivanii]|uniref:DNA internalization-related competence protein ComEC/Rec2 n=1 Tax=Legionella quinlivanii TaxID=45073 RepID=A0A364LNF9_9GAMM|nr:DNA internalization-related competence protein ComEC/Rec2 [Legionella quinlivanii]RAP38518.1 DNA internalization-related competence protein ComEC/Rec2 [Legionella quinlivanii]